MNPQEDTPSFLEQFARGRLSLEAGKLSIAYAEMKIKRSGGYLRILLSRERRRLRKVLFSLQDVSLGKHAYIAHLSEFSLWSEHLDAYSGGDLLFYDCCRCGRGVYSFRNARQQGAYCHCTALIFPLGSGRLDLLNKDTWKTIIGGAHMVIQGLKMPKREERKAEAGKNF